MPEAAPKEVANVDCVPASIVTALDWPMPFTYWVARGKVLPAYREAAPERSPGADGVNPTVTVQELPLK